MPRLKSKQLRRHALEAIEALQWIADNSEQIARRANDDVDECIRAINYDGDGRGGQELTQPEQHVHARTIRDPMTGELARDDDGQPIVRPDTVAERITRLAGLADTIRDGALEARTIGGKLIASVDPVDVNASRVAAEASRRVGAGHCSNCNTYCTGTFHDRLRGGRCDPCRKWKERTGEERPRDRWGNDDLLEELDRAGT